jgi:hypothetical protein
MIIVPELQRVAILVPRTGTRSLKNALLERYPESFMLYRHMEADGVPQGYDRWKKIGVVRHPVDRLWSLYKFLRHFGVSWATQHDTVFTKSMRDSVSVPFNDWLMNNQLPFTTPYDSAGLGRFYPGYTTRHPVPENRKSQFVYLRPDLGTRIYKFDDLRELYIDLGISDLYKISNDTEVVDHEPLSDETHEYVRRWFKWDYRAYLEGKFE